MWYANDLGERALLGFKQYQRQDLIGGRCVLLMTLMLVVTLIVLF